MIARKSEGGFTLVELLIVIVILGILAAVVVFAVSGITDRGQVNACKTDAANLRAANETYFSQNSTYGNEAALKAGGRIAAPSSLHSIATGANQSAADSADFSTAALHNASETTAATGAAYAIRVESTSCGTVGAVVTE